MKNKDKKVMGTGDTMVVLVLLVILFFLACSIFPTRSVSCEEVCIATKKRFIYDRELLIYVVFLKKDGSNYEHKVHFRSDDAFDMVAVGDTVRVYGKKYMFSRIGEYRFCEGLPGTLQHELGNIPAIKYAD